MGAQDSTRWTLIRRAAAGNAPDQAEFARRYSSVIRAYLGSRWRGGPLVGEIDDAVQQVFLQCYRKDGPLLRANPNAAGGFRAYLYGIVRNVAREMERAYRARKDRAPGSVVYLENIEARDAPLSRIFDRAWAGSLLRQAGKLQAQTAKGNERAERRLLLLQLRFREDLPIREIAKRWGADPAKLHEEYRIARREFLAALRVVVAEHSAGTQAQIEAECAKLLDLTG